MIIINNKSSYNQNKLIKGARYHFKTNKSLVLNELEDNIYLCNYEINNINNIESYEQILNRNELINKINKLNGIYKKDFINIDLNENDKLELIGIYDGILKSSIKNLRNENFKDLKKNIICMEKLNNICTKELKNKINKFYEDLKNYFKLKKLDIMKLLDNNNYGEASTKIIHIKSNLKLIENTDI